MTAKILIIDSDITLSTVLSDYLDSRGYKAHRVSDGKAGLNALSSEHFDGVLMELQGIGMNGYEVIKDIRHRLPQIPLIVLRIEAILRRIRAFEENKQRVFDLNGTVFDATHQTFDGQHMSSRESDLLLMLCRQEGEVVDKHKILSALWKEDNAFTARSLGVYINHLRAYLTPVNYEIIAVRYKGYKLVQKI